MADALIAVRPIDIRPIFRLTPLAWILLAAALTAAILAVKSGIAWMLSSSLTPEFSHAVIIPFVAAFLVWQLRDQIERMPFTGSWAGLLLVLLGAAFGALG